MIMSTLDYGMRSRGKRKGPRSRIWPAERILNIPDLKPQCSSGEDLMDVIGQSCPITSVSSSVEELLSQQTVACDLTGEVEPQGGAVRGRATGGRCRATRSPSMLMRSAFMLGEG